MFHAKDVTVIAVDIFGTTVDWRAGVIDGLRTITEQHGVDVDCPALVDAWRERYLPAVAQINSGQRPWANLDAIHREALDVCLDTISVSGDFPTDVREQMVRAWYVLPPWDDVVQGLRELRRKYVLIALSNGGFAQLTHVVKAAGAPFDAILSAENLGAYKPDPRAYTAAAKLVEVRPRNVLMVAAHTWDIHGARDAGMPTAFVERPHEKGPDRASDSAEHTDCDLNALSFIDLASKLATITTGQLSWGRT